MDRWRAAAALLALTACFAYTAAAPTASNQTALDLYEGAGEGCYYNFQHYGEGDRIMTNEPCLNCTCHNRMLMCYLRVCPFTKAIGQDCTVEKRADQCCPIVTCPDVPVDLLTSTSTSSPAEYGGTGVGKLDRYGCSINGKYFPEGSKVPPTPNKPCEHCYCIRNMTTCVMQECTLHVDGCTPVYHKDVCCPVRYSCDHPEDEIPLLDDMTTTVRPTPGFLLTTTTLSPVTQMTQDCVHDDQIFPDGALIKTEKACEHCYCMKGDIVCVVQECGTPMENEGKNCTSVPPREGQCCPDTYICEGDEPSTDLPSELVTGTAYEQTTTLSPPRRIVEGSGYRNEPDEPYSEKPVGEPEVEGSGEDQSVDTSTSDKQTPSIIDEMLTTISPIVIQESTEPEEGLNTVPSGTLEEDITQSTISHKPTEIPELETEPTVASDIKEKEVEATTVPDYYSSSLPDSFISREDEYTITTEPSPRKEDSPIAEKDDQGVISDHEESSSTVSTLMEDETKSTSAAPYSEKVEETTELKETVTESFLELHTIGEAIETEQPTTSGTEKISDAKATTSAPEKIDLPETTSVNPEENEIHEDTSPILSPGRIPGEGDCLLDGITYRNDSAVPSSNNCHSGCRCISSIIKCDPIICSPPPENMKNCQPTLDSPDSCCPMYVCDDIKETVPPESHSQMSGTESPVLPPAIECNGDQCQVTDDNKQPITPIDCSSDGCLGQTGAKPESGDCGENGCDTIIKSPVSQETGATKDEVCDKDTGCQAVPVIPCEGDNCAVGENIRPTENISGQSCGNGEDCQGAPTPDNKPCEGDSCKGVQQECGPEGCQTPVSPDICNDENGCKKPVDDELVKECTDENCRRKQTQDTETQMPSDCNDAECNEQPSISPAEQPSQENEQGTMSPIFNETPVTEEVGTETIIKASEPTITELPNIAAHPDSEHSTESQPELHEPDDATSKHPTIPEDEHETRTELPEDAITHAYTTTENIVKTSDTQTESTQVTEPHEIRTIVPDDSITKQEEAITKKPEQEGPIVDLDEKLTTISYDEDKKTEETETPDVNALPVEPFTNIPADVTDERTTVTPHAIEAEKEPLTSAPEFSDKEKLPTEAPMLSVTEIEKGTEAPEFISTAIHDTQTEIPDEQINEVVPTVSVSESQEFDTENPLESITEKAPEVKVTGYPETTESHAMHTTSEVFEEPKKEQPEINEVEDKVTESSIFMTTATSTEIKTSDIPETEHSVGTEKQEPITEFSSPTTESLQEKVTVEKDLENDLPEQATESSYDVSTQKSSQTERPDKDSVTTLTESETPVTSKFDTSEPTVADLEPIESEAHTKAPEVEDVTDIPVSLSTEQAVSQGQDIDTKTTIAYDSRVTEPQEEISKEPEQPVTIVSESETKKPEIDTTQSLESETKSPEDMYTKEFEMTTKSSIDSEVPVSENTKPESAETKTPESPEIVTPTPEMHITEQDGTPTEIPVSLVKEPEEPITKTPELTTMPEDLKASEQEVTQQQESIGSTEAPVMKPDEEEGQLQEKIKPVESGDAEVEDKTKSPIFEATTEASKLSETEVITKLPEATLNPSIEETASPMQSEVEKESSETPIVEPSMSTEAPEEYDSSKITTLEPEQEATSDKTEEKPLEPVSEDITKTPVSESVQPEEGIRRTETPISEFETESPELSTSKPDLSESLPSGEVEAPKPDAIEPEQDKVTEIPQTSTSKLEEESPISKPDDDNVIPTSVPITDKDSSELPTSQTIVPEYDHVPKEETGLPESSVSVPSIDIDSPEVQTLKPDQETKLPEEPLSMSTGEPELPETKPVSPEVSQETTEKSSPELPGSITASVSESSDLTESEPAATKLPEIPVQVTESQEQPVYDSDNTVPVQPIIETGTEPSEISTVDAQGETAVKSDEESKSSETPMLGEGTEHPEKPIIEPTKETKPTEVPVIPDELEIKTETPEILVSVPVQDTEPYEQPITKPDDETESPEIIEPSETVEPEQSTKTPAIVTESPETLTSKPDQEIVTLIYDSVTEAESPERHTSKPSSETETPSSDVFKPVDETELTEKPISEPESPVIAVSDPEKESVTEPVPEAEIPGVPVSVTELDKEQPVTEVATVTETPSAPGIKPEGESKLPEYPISEQETESPDAHISVPVLGTELPELTSEVTMETESPEVLKPIPEGPLVDYPESKPTETVEPITESEIKLTESTPKPIDDTRLYELPTSEPESETESPETPTYKPEEQGPTDLDKVTEPSVLESDKATESSLPESEKATESSVSESEKATESSLPESDKATESSVPESEKATESSEPESDKATESSALASDEPTESSVSESDKVTESSVPESEKPAEPPVPESDKATESSVPESEKATESSASESDKATESSVPESDKATESSVPESDKATESSVPESDKATESSVPESDKATESSVTESDKATVSSVPESEKATESSASEFDKATESSVPESEKATESSASESDKVTESSVPESDKATEFLVPESEKATESSVLESDKVTESSIPESDKATESSMPESDKATESSVPESDKATESSASESDKATESSVLASDKPTESSVSDSDKVTESSVPESEKPAEPPVPESDKATESSLSEAEKATESAVPESDKTTESSVPESDKVTESSISGSDKATESSVPESDKATESSVPESDKATESSITESDKATESSVPESDKATESSIPESDKATESSVPESDKATESSIPESEKTTESVPESDKATESSIAESEKATESVPESDKATESSVPESDKATESSVPESDRTTESSVPVSEKATESAVPETDKATELSVPESDKATESSVPESDKATESAVPESDKATESSVPEFDKSTERPVSDLDKKTETSDIDTDKGTESPIVDSDKATDSPVPDVEKATEIPESGVTVSSATSEQQTSVPNYEHPETTPYLIELQEHTHQAVDEFSTSAPEELSSSIPTEHKQVTPEISTETTKEQEVESSEKPASPEVYEDHTEPQLITEKTDKPSTEISDLEIQTEKQVTPTSKPHETDASFETTVSPVFTDKITKPEDKPVDSLPTTAAPEPSKPSYSDLHPTDELPSLPDMDEHFPPGTSGYGSEPDYVEEDQAFGPGTCRYGGKVYVSAQQIPRDDPCDFCFCFRSDIICLQQSCPPPIHGCHEEPIQGFCCPRYECPVSMATTLNVTTTTTTTTTTLPPHFPLHAYNGAAQRRGCQIKGHTYKVGEVVRASSGPCLHCTCGGDGQMKCDPKACTPEPMLRQMIAAAVSAKRRR